ncbi:MAG TPA: glutamine synthetase family protein [Candidatus Sumerlaeota bacterium]|nr:MAG: putative glutamine synthetase 2 [candidate division BRC1 bacterium ADurb.Bin183]HOE64362.1 glutamine synthetase family protein [Candidatus Sumerlaeota bacterium]HRR31331.1 glutamine synthetase family protein [Candidatus Sumerlaeia bacterium]HON50844.1 glutamine synthetase family protein [Candidatus Sumerlaeota bacterium]HOR65538.1 glutamine synthetase family protein [Candidatus Sumerlaeota bacterium]
MASLGKKRESILKKSKDNKVKFWSLWFADVLGFLKSFSISESEFEEAIEGGMGFDGSSIEGYARIEESDLIALPDPDTFCILPFEGKDDYKVGMMFCDIMTPDGKPYSGCPRNALRRMLKKAEGMGYDHFYVGPEMEFFFFKNSSAPEVLDNGGYFDMTTRDAAYDLRRKCSLALESMGIQVEYTHHEVAPSQHEIDMKFKDALKMADQVMSCRMVVKGIAQDAGIFATFMPKPIFGQNGSGMHVHQSLFKGNTNTFFDIKDKYQLSKVAKNYAAGLLKHSNEIVPVVAQWVNSYKRLVPGYEAPVYLSWARHNRSTLVRVPMYKPGKEKATRVEYRCPDPACNPYLAFAVMLNAGLTGIQKNYTLQDPIEEDIFEMNEKERKERGIESLPGSLYEALLYTQQSEVVKEALGMHIFEKFIENKQIEWERYRIHVTKYEVDRYMPIL